jgi:hypothetical protein
MDERKTATSPRCMEEQLSEFAPDFLKGVGFALSLVQSGDSHRVREALACCPESYRQGKNDSVEAILRFLSQKAPE